MLTRTDLNLTMKFWVDLSWSSVLLLLHLVNPSSKFFYLFSHGGRRSGTVQFSIFFFLHLITFLHSLKNRQCYFSTDAISFCFCFLISEFWKSPDLFFVLWWKALDFWLFDSVWVFAENDGAQKGLRGHNSEHSEGSSGSCNGVWAQSSFSPAGSLFFQGWGAQDASSLEEHARFEGDFRCIIFTIVFLIHFQNSLINCGSENFCAFVNFINVSSI